MKHLQLRQLRKKKKSLIQQKKKKKNRTKKIYLFSISSSFDPVRTAAKRYNNKQSKGNKEKTPQ